MQSYSIGRSLGRIVSAAALISSTFLLSACHEHDTTVLLKTGGAVEGFWYNDEENGPREFLGIPYAKAPIGNLRFAPPQAAKLSGLVETKAFGPSCVQNPGALSALGELSEDCLSLNVYTPAMEDGVKNLPVMVWIHGGAFLAGSSNQYDAINLAKDKNVIVVSLNYRLGALGFLSHPEMDAELGSPSGNLGLQDQQLALKWVKKNIKNFGGDANNITLFGESAGAMSVCTHIVAPKSQKLVNRFILQSGVCAGSGLPIIPKATVEYVSTTLAAQLCPEASSKLACLREKTPEEIMQWSTGAGLLSQPWGATVIPNGPILPETPQALMEKGEYNKGGIIVGTNQYEWSLFQSIGAAVSVSSIAEFNGFVDASYPAAQAAALKQAYAPPLDAYANIFLSTMITDQVFRCPARRFADLAQTTGSDVWLYSFEQANPAHAFEIPYIFNYVSAPLGIDPTNSPTKDVMQDYWASFATTGNPNAGTQPTWGTYDNQVEEYMILKDTPVAGTQLSSAACDLWNLFQN